MGWLGLSCRTLTFVHVCTHEQDDHAPALFWNRSGNSCSLLWVKALHLDRHAMSAGTSNCLCSKAGQPNRKPIALPLLFLRVTVQKTTCCHSKFIQLFNKICRVLGYDEQLSESHKRPGWGLRSVSCLLLSSALMGNSGERNFTSRPGKNLAWNFVAWLPATLGDSEPCRVRLFSSASGPRVTMTTGFH